MDRSPDLRPRTVGEILDAAFVLYRRRFGALLFVATLASVPTLVLAVALASKFGDAAGAWWQTYTEFNRYLNQHRGGLEDLLGKYFDYVSASVELNALLLSGVVVQAVARGAACVAGAVVATAAVEGRPQPPLRTILGTTLRRMPGPAALWTVAGFVTAMCCICFPLVLIVHAVVAACSALIAIECGPMETSVRRWGFAPFRWIAAPVAATFDAIGRGCTLSFHGMTLVRGSFAMSVLLTFLSTIVSVVSILAGVFWKSPGAWFVVQHYAEVLLLPVVGTASALWLIDLQVRREGIDLTAAEPT